MFFYSEYATVMSAASTLLSRTVRLPADPAEDPDRFVRWFFYGVGRKTADMCMSSLYSNSKAADHVIYIYYSNHSIPFISHVRTYVRVPEQASSSLLVDRQTIQRKLEPWHGTACLCPKIIQSQISRSDGPMQQLG